MNSMSLKKILKSSLLFIALIGVTFFVVFKDNSLNNIVETLINGTGAGMGFTLAIVLFAGIRERLELADIPETFQGYPITLIAAALMSIAFLGFTGLIKL